MGALVAVIDKKGKAAAEKALDMLENKKPERAWRKHGIMPV